MELGVSDPEMTLGDCGEHQLIERLRLYCAPSMIGDDAAVFAPPQDQQMVFSTDVLVDGVHFSLGMASPVVTMTPFDVGWRAAAANLSDIAAMGATPIGMTVGMAAPSHCPVAVIEDIYQGLAACCHTYGTAIFGGDTCRSGVLSLSISILGAAPPERLIYRHTARPGDLILATGLHGAARAGLECLLQPEWAATVPTELRQLWVHAHQHPQPRLDVVQWLWQQSPAPRVSGMDSSDGLADAVLQICAASGVGAILSAEAIPKLPYLDPEQALAWALYGGEDFELVLCLPPAIAPDLCAMAGNHAAILGEITATPEVLLQQGKALRPLQHQQTFQHFSR
jgi:thiamine-monophosphate kinase